MAKYKLKHKEEGLKLYLEGQQLSGCSYYYTGASQVCSSIE